MAIEVENFLREHSGWAQLLLTVVAWSAMTGVMWKGLTDGQEVQRENSTAIGVQLSRLGDQINRLAISNEVLNTDFVDLNRRVERVEKKQDEIYGPGHVRN